MSEPQREYPPSWQNAVSWSGAILTAIIFLSAGLWKASGPQRTAVFLTQALVPQSLSLAAAFGLAIAETTAGILVLIPRFRRWGAWLAVLLLVAFIAYIGWNYQTLRGADCSCFPWLKRSVGPGFFVGDGIMLLFALAAVWTSRRPRGIALPIMVAGAVAVFAAASWCITAMRQTGVAAPITVQVDGKPYSLYEGKVFIYFFDPECMHCYDAGKRMSKLDWGETKFVGVASRVPQFAAAFFHDTGLHGVISTDFEPLRKTFPYTSTPAGVALENGHEIQALSQFDEPEPAATLRKLGMIK